MLRTSITENVVTTTDENRAMLNGYEVLFKHLHLYYRVRSDRNALIITAYLNDFYFQ